MPKLSRAFSTTSITEEKHSICAEELKREAPSIENGDSSVRQSRYAKYVRKQLICVTSDRADLQVGLHGQDPFLTRIPLRRMIHYNPDLCGI
jgi:hypothetical protein